MLQLLLRDSDERPLDVYRTVTDVLVSFKKALQHAAIMLGVVEESGEVSIRQFVGVDAEHPFGIALGRCRRCNGTRKAKIPDGEHSTNRASYIVHCSRCRSKWTVSLPEDSIALFSNHVYAVYKHGTVPALRFTLKKTKKEFLTTRPKTKSQMKRERQKKGKLLNQRKERKEEGKV